ncbi:Os03g0377201, partial [Oryza sativa Japonica Group]
SGELASGEGLAERPSRRRDVVRHDGSAVAGGHRERQRLPVEQRAALPVLAPVPRHGLPPRLPSPAGLHRHRVHVAGAAHVAHQHQVEVGVPVDGEPHPSLPPARHPAVGDGDDAGLEAGDAEEGGLGEVEVVERRVAPAAAVAGERVVGRAQVGGRHHDGLAGRRRQAPPPVAAAAAAAPQLEAGAAAQPVPEHHRAQRRRVRA